MLACGVCGSDVSEAYVARKLSAGLGHEVVGEVLQTGAGVTGVAAGDRVVIHHHAPCGVCRRCRRGHETLCDRFRSTALAPGGLAEQVLVEAPLVPELLALGDLDPLAGTFVEPLGCVVRALGRARLTAGESLLVVGTGSDGLLAIAAAQARGADPRLDPRAARRAPPGRRALGAAQHADEPVDVAFVTSARPDAVAGAAAALGPGGTMCLCATTKPGRRWASMPSSSSCARSRPSRAGRRDRTTCARLPPDRRRADRSAGARHAPQRPRRDRACA